MSCLVFWRYQWSLSDLLSLPQYSLSCNSRTNRDEAEEDFCHWQRWLAVVRKSIQQHRAVDRRPASQTLERRIHYPWICLCRSVSAGHQWADTPSLRLARVALEYRLTGPGSEYLQLTNRQGPWGRRAAAANAAAAAALTIMVTSILQLHNILIVTTIIRAIMAISITDVVIEVLIPITTILCVR